ncbi:MAG: DUF362 domain-containing protein [Desulfobacteraceae bacterium]
MTVGIVQSDYSCVKGKMETLLDLVGYEPKNKNVFIKPNVLGPFDPASGIVTHPGVVGALVWILQKKGASVVVGESSVVGTDTMASFKKAGYCEMADKYGIPLLDLNKEKRREVKVNNRLLKLPEILFSHEYINMPKLKTHDQAFVSIAMKNQKGLLLGKDKKNFHKKGNHGLGENVKQLASVVQPALNVVDGIDALEGNGPGRWGVKKKMNILVAGCDMVSVDNACVDIMGFDIRRIGYIPAKEYVTAGADIETVREPFAAPELNRPKQLLNCRFHLGEACSGCSQNIRAAMTGLWKRPFRAGTLLFQAGFHGVDIVAGRCDSLDQKEGGNNKKTGKVICIGECTRNQAEKNGYRFIPGCPPDVNTIISNL